MLRCSEFQFNQLCGPGTPETSLAELATKSVPVNAKHNNKAGIETADIKEIYVPAKPYTKKKYKN